MNGKILLIFLLLRTPFLLKAGGIETQALIVNREGVEVTVNFNAIVPKDAVRGSYRLVITPVLYNDAGGSIALQPFIVSGRQRARRDRQQRLLAKEGSLPENYVICGNTLLYGDSTKYASWMREGKLSLRLDMTEEGCCDVKSCPSDLLAENLSLEFAERPKLTEMVPQVSEVTRKASMQYPFLRMLGKEADDGRGISVRFRVAQNDIDPGYSTNRKSLKDLLNAIGLVRTNNRTSLEKITITGYASPEGSREQNSRLSQMRADALKGYIVKEIGMDGNLFEISGAGEDWQGLKELVEKSDMPYKKEVLDIIENTPEESRNDRLKRLAGGRPYSGMIDVLYPQLRDACYINVWYSEKADVTAEAVNEAISLMATRRYDEALAKLKLVKNDSRAWNALGVCFQMKGDIEEACEWFTRATETGDAEAAENLNRLKRK